MGNLGRRRRGNGSIANMLRFSETHTHLRTLNDAVDWQEMRETETVETEKEARELNGWMHGGVERWMCAGSQYQ